MYGGETNGVIKRKKKKEKIKAIERKITSNSKAKLYN
jgi:hypothetical protein